jgi:hypothetical protein
MKHTKKLFYLILLIVSIGFTNNTMAQTGATCSSALSLTISPGQNTGWQNTSSDTLWYTFNAPNEVCIFNFETSFKNKRYLKNVVYGTCSNLFPADFLHQTNDSTSYLKFLNLAISQNYKIGLVFGLTGNCTSCSNIGTYKISYVSAASSYTGCPVASCDSTPSCEYLCNGNFEQYGGSSNGIPQTDSEIQKACGWRSGNNATPDYYHTSSPTTAPSVNIPTNFAGCEGERTNKTAYAGFFTANNFYEALVSPLKSTLISGNKYDISFYLSLGDDADFNTTNGIAYAFANNYIPAGTPTGTVYNAFGTTMTHTVIDTSPVSRAGWTAFSFSYTATGNETHFLIGGLPLNQSPTTVTPTGGVTCSSAWFPRAYYYVDDISVRDQPTFTVSATNTLICTGSVTLSVSPPNAGTSYTWTSFPATSSLASQTGPTVAVSPTVTTTYSVTMGPGGCGYTDIITVNVVNYAINVTSSNAYYCPGNPVTLTANGGATTYTWAAPVNANTQTVSVSPSSTTTYTVYGNGPNCPLTYSATATVSVPASPSFSISTSQTVCVGATVTVTPGPNTTLGTVVFFDANNSYPFNPYTFTAPGSYSVYVDGNENTCNTFGSAEIPITVLSSGSNPTLTITPSQTICAGQTRTLTISGATNYTWTPGGATTTSIVVTPTATTVYSVTGTTSCGQATITTTITVLPNPTVTASASPTAICSGFSSTLTANGASTYTWMPGGATTASTIVTPTATTIYTVTGKTGICSNTKTVSVTVKPTPTVTVNSATICSGTSTVLTASGATTYSWNTGATTNTINVSPTSTTNYTVTGTTNGCVNTKTATVTVASSPTVSVASKTICAGSCATLTASGANTYTWSAPISSTVNPVVVCPTVTTIYTVTGQNTGCATTSVKTATVTVIPALPGVLTISTSVGSPVVNNGTGTNTIVLSSSITNTTGLTFNWEPSGATTPTTAFNLTQPEIISLSVYNNVCGTSLTQSICVNYVSASCSGTFATLNNATITGTASLGATTATYNVTGTLTINWPGPLALGNKTFIMATGSKVEITATSDVTFNNLKFYSCNGLWRGIEVKTSPTTSARLTISGDDNSIEDAYMGVYCVNPSGANLNPTISCDLGVLFNKNYYDVYLENTKNATVPYTFNFSKSRMYSQSTNNSPGGNLKCSGYYTPTVKSRSYAGLYATNAGIVNFNFGVFSPSDYNQVKNKDYGLYFNNTNANVNNVAFSDAIGIAPNYTLNFNGTANGVGVYSKNSGYLNIKPANTPTTGITTTFNNLGYQVITNNTFTVDVQNTSYTTSVQGFTVDPSWLNKPAWGGSSPGTAGYGLNGVFVTNASNVLRVNNNTFTNNYYPVTANYTVAPSPSNIMSIAQNTISTTNVNGIKEGVTFNSALSFTPTPNNMRIASNTFSNVTIGVKVTATSIGLRISSNTFTIHPSGTNPKGIYIAGSNTVTVDNNTIYGSLTSTNVANWSPDHHGILLVMSSGCKVQCNTISNVGIGVEYRGINTSSGDGFFGNILKYPIRRGLFITNGGIIGTQGSSAGASANQWINGTSSWPAVNTADPNKTSVGGTLIGGSASQSANSYLYVLNNANELPNDNYITSPSVPADRYLLGTTIFTITAGNYATCPTTLTALKMAQSAGNSNTERDADFVNYINTALPSSNTTMSPQDKFMLKQFMFDDLTQNPSTDNTLIAFYNQQQNTSVDVYHEIDSLLANGNINSATAKNAQASQSNDITETQNAYNTLYINGINNQTDLDNLSSIADLCPQLFGNAVYQARALLQSITYVSKVYTDSCDNSKVRKSIWLDDEPTSVSVADGVQAKLYPNPNNGSFTLAYDLKTLNIANVTIYDISGKLVYSKTIDNLESRISINTLSLNNGIYFIQLSDDTKLLWTDKLVIQK